MKRVRRREGSRKGSGLGVHIEGLEARRLMSFVTADSVPDSGFEFDGLAYFVATDGLHGPEIWRTDGTEAGTNLFMETVAGPGSQFSVGAEFVAIEYHGLMYFSVNGYLWRSDGTQAGTVKVSENRIGWYRPPVIFNDAMYYVPFGDGIMRSDGTEAGTTKISSIIYANIMGVGSEGLLISGRDAGTIVIPPGSGPRAGTNFYVSDGTAAGMLKTNLQIDYTGSYWADQIDEKVVFAITIRTTTGSDIGTYVSDGSLEGTTLLTTEQLNLPQGIGDRAILHGSSGVWVTDGTTEGTLQISDIRAGAGVNERAELGSIAYFADGGSNTYLARSDGTAEGTFALPLPGDAMWGRFIGSIESTQLFTLHRAGQSELWQTDGTVNGTAVVSTINLQASSIAGAGDQLIFVARSPEFGSELFVTDGTSAGTHLLKDINVQPLLANPTPAAGEPHYSSGSDTYYRTTVRMTGQAPAGSTVVLFDDANEIGRGVAGVDGAYLITPSEPLSGRLNVRAVVAGANGDASAPATSPRGLEIYVDGSAPTLIRSFRANGSVHSLRIEFNEPIEPSTFTLDAIRVENLTTQQDVPAANMSIVPQGTDNKIFEVLFSGYPGGTLPDGAYRGTITTVGITDRIGNAMTSAPSPETWTLYPLTGLTIGLIPWGGSGGSQTIGGTFRYGAALEGFIDGQRRGPGYSSRGDYTFGSLGGLSDGMHLFQINASLDGVTEIRSLNVLISGGVPTVASLAKLSNRVVRVSGTEGDDRILVRRNSADPSLVDILVSGVVVDSFALGQIDLVQVMAGGGSDRVEFASDVLLSTKVYGGAGNDTIIGSRGGDRVYGGDGNDWISGGLGNDTMYGEAGNDRMFGGAGRDYVDGGAGADVLRGEGEQDRIFAKAGEDDFRGNSGDLISLV